MAFLFQSPLDRACRRLRNNDGTFRVLHLNNNEIGDDGVTALAHALEGDMTLQRLYLSNNQIRAKGVTALAHALEGNTTLQVLHLGSNQISDKGVTALAPALKGNTTLQRLYLYNNKIGEKGVTALAHALKGNTTLQGLYLENNQISDEGVMALASLLTGNTTLRIFAYDREITESDKPKEITESDKPKDRAADDGEIAPFYDKLIKLIKLYEKDVIAVTRLLRKLSSFIDDVHEMKIYYTYVACYCRMGLIDKVVAGSFIRNGLHTVSTKCQDHDSVVIFKLINEKAYEDGYLTRWDFHDGDQLAEHARFQPMFESLADAIRANTARIEGLEANLVAINNSVNQIRKGLRRKYCIEAATGFISAVINAISMGIGGGLVNAASAFYSVIDYGDIDHLKENFADNAALLGKVNEGLALADQIVLMAGDNLSDSKLKNVVNNEEDVVIGLVVAAKLVQHPNWSGNLGIPDCPPAVTDGIAEATIPESGAVEGENMFADAELDEEEESRLPLHAAIKFGFKNDLKELLERTDEVDVNQLDSKERTPADFAALCGEEDLLELIKSHGGKFHVKSAARMKAIARKRAPYAAQRLNSILEAL